VLAELRPCDRGIGSSGATRIALLTVDRIQLSQCKRGVVGCDVQLEPAVRFARA
jgi:hypothetical protein